MLLGLLGYGYLETSSSYPKISGYRLRSGRPRMVNLEFCSTESLNIYLTYPGPLVYLNVAGQPIIVLNSHKVAADLLDRRASIYSDRPPNIVASDMLTGGLLVVFTRYGDV